MARRFIVEVPVVMRVSVEVKADTKDEAIEKVFTEGFRVEVTNDENYQIDTEVFDWEWEMYEKVTRGNVYSGCINEVDAFDDGPWDEEEEV